MATTSSVGHRALLPINAGLKVMIAGYAAFWLLLALAPANRTGWLLENALTVVGLGVLVSTYRVFPLSNVSYALIGLFISLHNIGAHYGYAEVPFGHWLRDVFNFSRNHYDRLVHFAFGLLLAYPTRELILRTTPLRGFWAFCVPLSIIIASSAVYEILEMWVAMVLRPEEGIAWLGTQGDPWDAQKDMAMAAVGAFLMVALATRLERRRRA